MSTPTILLEARSAQSSGAWVDISSRLLLNNPLTLTRGREREDATAAASTCTLTLDNQAGEFTEGRTSTIGGVSLTWARWAQLRVSINGQLRFTGWLTGLGQSWPLATESSATVTVTASGVKAALAVSPNLSSWIKEMYEDLSPVAWWPLDDAPLPAWFDEDGLARQVVAGKPGMTIHTLRVGDSTAIPWAFGASAPEWFEVGSVLELSPTAELVEPGDPGVYSTAAVAFASADLPSPIAPPFTVLFVHQPNYSAQPAPVPILSMVTPGGSAVVLWRNPLGNVRLDADPVSGMPMPPLQRPMGRLADGVPRLIGLACTASETRYLGSSYSAPAVTSLARLALCNGRRMNLDANADARSGVIASGLYGQVAIVSGAMSEEAFANLRSRVEGGLGTDLEWLQRACSFAGTAAPAKLGPTRPIMRPNLRGSNPAAIGDQMADAYGGMLTDGRDGTPTLVDPRYVPTQASVPVISLDDVDGASLRWSSDPTLRVTEASQGEHVMASRSSWPRVRVDIDQGVPAADAQARAYWLVNSSGVAEAPRLTGIEIDLLAMPSTSAIEPLAYLHRPRVRIAGPLPSQLPASLRTMTVEGTTETVSVSEWRLALSTAPDPRFILADEVQGVLGVPADNRLGF